MTSSTQQLSIGSIIRIKWLTEDTKTDEFDVEIIEISRNHLYSIRFLDLYDDQGHPIIRKSNLSLKEWILSPINGQVEADGSKSVSDSLKARTSSKRKREGLINVSYNSIQIHNPILKKTHAIPDYRYILAPMVGGSELAFRMLCRRYGATLAYTPMINSNRFANDEEYRQEQFQTIPTDRPLVAHFAANSPENILQSAQLVESQCDAIDINLGCPQRIAFTGHFGSYLLDEEDRSLVVDMVNKLATNLSIPVFVKIRLLDEVEDTIRLCEQLAEAGASLIAVHGRYRVNLVGRTGPGARDGPAHLDQIQTIVQRVKATYPHLIVVTNGNTITHDDITANLSLTKADGIMCAEGLLDNPALYSSSVDIKPIQLAYEYLDLVEEHPIGMKTVLFHVRRICRDFLSKYLLLEDLMNATSVEQVRSIVTRIEAYESNPETFIADKEKERTMKEAIERRKQNESKRKEYEARMVRKAKREGKALDFYLKLGTELPSYDDLQNMKAMSKEESFKIWKEKHSQHCYAYHFDHEKCPRERTCGFLHVDLSYADVVAYG
jgi:tRNA-dihydrouridine synthase 1